MTGANGDPGTVAPGWGIPGRALLCGAHTGAAAGRPAVVSLRWGYWRASAAGWERSTG